MGSTKKQVIVFISSTFRDMHSERDYLVKHVFPELRDWCQKKKGVSLVELDLRWGVTEEEAQHGEVINICLSEIERSRPFFIGLLGERYGWIPPTFEAPDGPILDWLKEQDSRNSMTALEILKGVLDDPVMHDLAYFYFRDPAFKEEMPEEKRYEVDAESDESRRLQSELKQRILDLYGEDSENLYAYHPRYGGLKLNWYQLDEKLKKELNIDEYALVRDVGSDGFIDPEEWEQLSSSLREKLLPLLMVNLEEESLEAFGRQVLENLKTAIDKRFEDKPEYTDPLDVERTAHADFLAAKTELFVGREKEVADGLKTLAGNPVIYVWGDGGSGKSAYMANLIKAWREQDPDTPACFFFLGTTGRTQNLLSTLETAYLEITRKLSIQQEDFPDSVLKASEFFARFLGGIEQPLLLAFDALDQLEDRDEAFSFQWLPPEIPDNLTVLISSLPGKGVENAGYRNLPCYHLEGLSDENSRKLVTQYLQHYRKKLGYDSATDTDQMALLLSKREATLPLYLITASEELRIFPRYEEITARIEQLPDTVPELFTQVIQLLESDFGEELVCRALSLIAVSRAGLTEEELLDLLAPEGLEKLPAVVWSRFYLRIKAYLSGTSTAEGLLRFFHRQLAGAVSKRYLTDDDHLRHLHVKLGDYFTGRAKGNDDSHRWETGYARGFSENVYHYIRAEDLQTVAQVLGDFAYPMEKLRNDGLHSLIEDMLELRFGNYEITNEALNVTVDFYATRSHILRRENPEWSARKILLQLAIEHADNSPVSTAAESWLGKGKCDWLWLRNERRPTQLKHDPNIAVFEGHDGPVIGAFELQDGRILSWSHSDFTPHLWEADGRPSGVLKGHSHVVMGAVQLSNKRILTWSEDETLRIWSNDGRPLMALAGHTGPVTGAIELSDGRILSWSIDTSLRVWQLDGHCDKTLEGHSAEVLGAIELSDGRILSWADDESLRFWDADGTCASAPSEGPMGSAEGMIELPGGGILLWRMDDGRLQVRDPAAEELSIGEEHVFLHVTGALELSNGRILSWGGYTHSLRLFDAGRCTVSVLEGSNEEYEMFVSTGARELSDGRIVSWYRNGTLRIWDPNGHLLSELQGHSDSVMGVRQLSNGRILSWGMDNTLQLWDTDGRPLTVLQGHGHGVSGAVELSNGWILSWSSDEPYLQDSEEVALRMWDSEGAAISVIKGHTGWINGAYELMDQRILSWSDDGTLRLWDVAGDTTLDVEKAKPKIEGVLEISDGRILSWNVDHTLRMWDTYGQLLAVFEGHSNKVSGVIELRDGRILSWSCDCTLRLWDSRGRMLAVLEGHESDVHGAAELANGRIVSWSLDYTLRLWNAEGRPMRVLEGHGDNIGGVLELSSGHILSWSRWSDATLRLWDTDGQALAEINGHTPGVYIALELPDGRIISLGSGDDLFDDNLVSVWDASLQLLFTLPIDEEVADMILSQGVSDSRAVFRGSGNTAVLRKLPIPESQDSVLWHAESPVTHTLMVRGQHPVLAQANGQMCRLALYQGSAKRSLLDFENSSNSEFSEKSKIELIQSLLPPAVSNS